jgi:hypothetical protein
LYLPEACSKTSVTRRFCTDWRKPSCSTVSEEEEEEPPDGFLLLLLVVVRLRADVAMVCNNTLDELAPGRSKCFL